MLAVLISFGFNFLLFVLFSTILYNVFLVIRYFRLVKFSYSAGAFYLPCLPFIGNIYVALFTGMRVNPLAMLVWLEKYFGMPANLWVGVKYHYVTNNAEEAKIILNHPKCLNKSPIYDDWYILRNSVGFIHGEKWKPRRRYLRTAYKLNKMKSYYPSLFHQSCLLIDKIKSMPPNKDLYTFFNEYTFLNFILSAFGLDGSDIELGIEENVILIDSIQEEYVKLMLNPVMPASIWTLTPGGAKFRCSYRKAKVILGGLLLQRKKQQVESAEYIENQGDSPLADLLLGEEYKADSDKDVLNELVLFAGAATDSTGHTLVFCFTLLGMYPEIQQRVYEEVITPAEDRDIEYSNIQELKYTEAFISETLRIFPTVPSFGRHCCEDVDIGKKVVPKGANILISAYHIHRNPLYWPDPLRFDPSRFLPDNSSKIVPGSYLPFSIGPRNCIGLSMAMVLLKLTVAQVIKEFRITSSHQSINEFILESDVTMKTLNRLDCNFIPRVVERDN